MKPIDDMKEHEINNLFEPNQRAKRDYTAMEEVTVSVVTIDSLPGGFDKKAQKLSESIEIVKTKMIDVGDGLRAREIMPNRMINQKEVNALIKSGKFTKAMTPNLPRACRDCGSEMPADRHWTCRKCLPVLPDEVSGLEYCGVSGE